MKLSSGVVVNAKKRVAPFTGAWIETVASSATSPYLPGRPLHGGVD